MQRISTLCVPGPAEYGSSHRQRGTSARKSLDEEHIVVPSCADSYDLRHAFVSLLLAKGRSVVYVASQAGHAPSMTLDTYAHVIGELETGERVPAEGVSYAARGELVRTMFARDTEDSPADSAELHDLQEFPESPLRDSNPGPPPYHGGALPLS
jgi:hypothetical protein